MKSLLCATFLLGGPLSLLAQDAPRPVDPRIARVHLRNGNSIDGTLLKRTDQEVLLLLTEEDATLGEMSIRNDQIDRVEFRVRPPKPTPKPPEGEEVKPGGSTLSPREVKDRVTAILERARKAPAEQKHDIMKETIPLGAPAALLLSDELETFPEIELTQSVTPLLMEMKVKETIPILISKLEMKSPSVKACAAALLGNLGDTTVIGDLLPLLKDPAPNVKRAAICAVATLNSRQAIRYLPELGKDPSKEVRREALSAYLTLCKKHGEESDIAGTLSALLDNARGEAKVEIILAIAESRQKEAWVAVVRTLKDDDIQVRSLSAVALGALGAREAQDAIVDRLSAEQDTNVRTALAETAAKLKLPRSVGPLVDWLRHEDAQVKVSAMTALRTLTGQNFGLDPQKWLDWWAATKPR